MYENSFTFTKMLAAYAKPHRFTDRSTRTELLGYLIIAWFVGAVVERLFLVAGVAGFVKVDIDLLSLNFAYLIMWLPFPALAVRRFHDQDRSGWWAAAVIVPSILTWIGAYPLMDQTVRIVLGLIYLGGLALLFWKPTDGENRYGPDPRLDPYEATFV
jgi:uncharacterized membrane protein YhaH (DUF805 family)